MSSENTEDFVAAIQKQLGDSDGELRKNYLRIFVDRGVVDDEEVRISGPKSTLVQGLIEAKKDGHSESDQL